MQQNAFPPDIESLFRITGRGRKGRSKSFFSLNFGPSILTPSAPHLPAVASIW
jgi:hypothetical protein